MADMKTLTINGVQYQIVDPNATPASHAEDKNNPHGVTIAQIGAAPSGYGLGAYPNTYEYSQIDTLMLPGWYRVNVNATINGVYVSAAHMEVSSINEYNVVQTLYTTTCPVVILIRQKYSEEWQSWVDYSPSAFAPAGYGLGKEMGRWCDDANTATEIGFYALSGAGTLNAPDSYIYGTMIVERRGGCIYQTIKNKDGFPQLQMIVRCSEDYGATWSEWEYVNPPMVPGVEYRTTERWNGEPVYTMAINFGALPNNGSRTVESIINADAEDIRIDGVVTSGGSCRPLWTLIHDVSAYANHTSKGFVTLETNADRSAWNATLILKYVVRV